MVTPFIGRNPILASTINSQLIIEEMETIPYQATKPIEVSLLFSFKGFTGSDDEITLKAEEALKISLCQLISGAYVLVDALPPSHDIDTPDPRRIWHCGQKLGLHVDPVQRPPGWRSLRIQVSMSIAMPGIYKLCFRVGAGDTISAYCETIISLEHSIFVKVPWVD
jgi:hypothetical protein